ncbi:M61 family metallopeptidase [Thalassotalea piscium]|uniref:Putative metalloprotease with PDZ domain n=1 Tax=Thalassotalea piscium TaxID=1230533 RepID=A0A7X0NES6_9GAMM|nr:M61 family metallopeptidase [Thalassotalea piscium]MBB6542104.1 putative metalloprotease with PDZ domain [Thalassotalea piscium]
MRKLLALALLVVIPCAFANDTTLYQVSFDNAEHHEAQISVTFSNIQTPVLEVQMSRSSPGRYALHEFAKNVYNVRAVNSQGQPLQFTRPNPYQWHINDHDGEVTITYTLFGDRGDGTYAQIDRTHAHLNAPASFMWATGHEKKPISIEFQPFKANWKVATQLPKGDGKYHFTAPNLAYFLDSPIELSDHQIREWKVSSDGRTQIIRLAVHHDGTDADLEKFTAMAKNVVNAQIEVFGELPRFDYGEYTFIACYLPHVSGDGMEHRNSTIITSSTSLDEGEYRQLGTLSHEFFHAWNVERIRPKELEPFNYIGANITPNLWFAEGFTSYYDDLLIRRAQEMSIDEYLEAVSATVNHAYHTPGRLYFTPEGASMLATFTDAGTSIDKTNFSNTFFSYYRYGSARALALDLSIRSEFSGKTLDDVMKAMWHKFGKTEAPYSREDLQSTVAEVTGSITFAKQFFNRYIYGKETPDYHALLAQVGLQAKQVDDSSAYLGRVNFNFRGQDAIISNNIPVNSPLYNAGIERGDQIVKLGRRTIRSQKLWENALAQFTPDDTTTIEFIQRGEKVSKQITFITNPELKVSKLADDKITEQQTQFFHAWLGKESPGADSQ